MCFKMYCFVSILNIFTSHKSQSSTSEGYDKSVRQSYIYTLGGPKFKTNMSVDQWTDGVDNNLIAMDRSGDPLYFFITPKTVPEFSENIVESIANTVQESIEAYYEMNTVRGCTKLGEPNFSFSANFDDGTCKKDVSSDIMFGGVYQTCTEVSYGRQCTNYAEVNPKTGTYSCPDLYTPVEIYTYTEYTTILPYYYTGYSYIKSYWCARDGKAEPNSGYLFGGIYSNNVVNTLTGSSNCPPGFYSRSVFFNWHVCISDDFELYSRSSVPFGGFFTCNTGNPLATGTGLTKIAGANAVSNNSLRSFIVKGGAKEYAKRCPDGFSQHLVDIKEGCSFYYCVRTGSLNSPSIMSVKRPPFMDQPKTNSSQKVSIFKGAIKEQVPENNDLKESSPSTTKMSSFSIAGVITGTVIGCFGIAVIIVVLLIKRRSRRSSLYSKLLEESSVNYGTDRAE